MANTKVLIKRSVANTAPVSLSAGELAYSYASNTLFIGSSDGSAVLSVSKLASQSAYDQANTATNNAASASQYANTGINIAGAAFDQANAANSLAQAAFNAANSASSSSTDQYARDSANSASLYANTGINNAASASLYANTGINNAASASQYANTGINNAASASLYANTGINNAASASLYANSGITLAQDAYNQANTANTKAQNAWDAANGVNFGIAGNSGADTLYNSELLLVIGEKGITTVVTDGEISINVDNTVVRSNTSGIGTQVIQTAVNIAGDLSVTGNLIITGNIQSQNVQTLEVSDPLILLGVGNYFSDAKDIGFAAHYNDGSNAHTGLIRDSSTKDYHFFKGYTGTLDANNNINLSDPSYQEANVTAAFFKGNLIGATAVVGGVNIGTHVQNAYDQANTATNNAASASLYANTGINNAASASQYANTGINNAASASLYANSGINLAQAAFNQGNSTATVANTAVNDAASASLYANTGVTLAQAAFNQANTTQTFAVGGLFTNVGYSTGKGNAITVSSASGALSNYLSTLTSGSLLAMRLVNGGSGKIYNGYFTLSSTVSGVGFATVSSWTPFVSGGNNPITDGATFTDSTTAEVYTDIYLARNSRLNDVTGLAQAAFNAANSASSSSTDQYARDTANSAGIYANTGINNAASASLYANTGINNAASASAYANTGINNAASASLYANNAINNAASASAYANAGITLAQSAYDTVNGVSYFVSGDSGFYIAANGDSLIFTGGSGITTSVTNASPGGRVTIDVDNTVIRTTGGQTISGSLSITGDLIVSGNTVTTDVSTLVVEDSLIELAANNSSSDSLDIGFFGQYASGGVKYTSLVRDASDGKYKLLIDGTEKPAAGNTVNVAAFSTGTLVTNIEAGSVSTSTLTATGLSYLESPGATDGIVYRSSSGEIKYSFTVDGGTF